MHSHTTTFFKKFKKKKRNSEVPASKTSIHLWEQGEREEEEKGD